jgi:hypothetical protein
MSKATLNRQQAEAIATLARDFGHVEIHYDYGGKLIVSYGHVARAVVWTTGKVEIEP